MAATSGVPKNRIRALSLLPLPSSGEEYSREEKGLASVAMCNDSDVGATKLVLCNLPAKDGTWRLPICWNATHGRTMHATTIVETIATMIAGDECLIGAKLFIETEM